MAMNLSSVARLCKARFYTLSFLWEDVACSDNSNIVYTIYDGSNKKSLVLRFVENNRKGV